MTSGQKIYKDRGVRWHTPPENLKFHSCRDGFSCNSNSSLPMDLLVVLPHSTKSGLSCRTFVFANMHQWVNLLHNLKTQGK